MGLVIVVILISLGMLFLLRFVVFQPVAQERAVFTQEQIAEGTLRTLLETKTDCREKDMTDLIQDCAADTVITECETESCQFLEQEVAKIFGKTLRNWNKHFEFIVRVEFGQNWIQKIKVNDTQGCPGERDQARQPLPPGDIEVVLNVCD